ncbi:MAG: MAPEG family protein [Alphaproteobacteria bacterium]|jgi:uncharacterized MAPEG superfamily protein|nr:MAPEG family protein [Alphaproteobacteria bacterium]MDP6564528.1 MAPEG family protein [Alphaproteobacteria bacterium]MDP6811664.1 MAPEG family protein [Alphaproteobacteria bacterium]
MTVELWMLFWAVVLTLVQMVVAVTLAIPQVGMAALAGNREGVTYEGMADRGLRAHRNMLESLVLFAALVIAAHLAGLSNATSALGAQIFVIARLVYAVVYLIGIPWLRTGVWAIGLIGLLMVGSVFLTAS